MRELRAAHGPVTDAEIATLWTDETQLARAVSGLLADGLAVSTTAGYLLP